MNRIFAVSGVSGSGKTTIMKQVMSNELISVTTRQPRVGELEGDPYYFITHEEFKELYDSGELVESNDYAGHGNNYGVTRSEYELKTNLGDCYFICDIEGMRQIKALHPNCISIYLLSDKEDVEERMRLRGDMEENIIKRLSTYEEEVKDLIHYDHVVENEEGKMEDTVRKLKEIIFGEQYGEA